MFYWFPLMWECLGLQIGKAPSKFSLEAAKARFSQEQNIRVLCLTPWKRLEMEEQAWARSLMRNGILKLVSGKLERVPAQ